MCKIEDPDITMDKIFEDLYERLNNENNKMSHVKKLYKDEESFDKLMNDIVEKDLKRFESLFIDPEHMPAPSNILYIVIDIVQNEGESTYAPDIMAQMLPSRTLKYYGWTFSWVHGVDTVISIYNRKNELVYRF